MSKRYELVQHNHIVEELEYAIAQVGLDAETLDATLTMTVYGERMWASFILPRDSLIDFNLDNSSYVLRINALNSVDKSTPLEINVTWYSLDSKTSLLVRRNARLKKIHLKSRKSKGIKEFLENQIRQASGDLRQIRAWNQQLLMNSPRRGQIELWIDEIVANRWGVHAAARVYHIARTGYDGEIDNRFEGNVKPHERQVQSSVKVSGKFTPVRNACDIWQVLCWFANQRTTIQNRFDFILDIPVLMRALMKLDKPLTILIDEELTDG
ncbi:MAG: hypothetical protein OXP71_02385 [Candidatus Poribacteria bacterium]|nr:hypothetical protein [Candidatus Poribacteria bacterium]